jgi:GNAT superfamily N-acetyltransferase
MNASERATQLIEEIKAAVGISDSDDLAKWWDEDADRLNKMAEDARKIAVKVESRAFCPTGEGGGIDNSCGLGDKGPKMAPDGAGGGGPRSVSGKDALKLLEKIAQNPDGFTLDPANADQPETGIMVSEFTNDSRRSVKIKASEIKTAAGQQAFLDWFDNNADLLAGDLSRFIGGWKTGDDFYIDVATRFDPDKAEQALEAGRKSGQLAVFNLGTFKETWVQYDKDDKRKPEGWDSGFARARKDAAAKQVYDESSPAMQDEDWAGELSEHGKKTVRNYNEEPEEAVVHDPDSAIRHSEQADTHRNVSSVPGIPGEVVRGEGREARSGLVRGLSGGEAGTLQGSAGASEGRRHSVESRDDCGRTPDGKFGPKNDCQKDGEGSSATDTKEREPAKTAQPSPLGGDRYVDVFSRAASSRATVRSEDGKTIERTSIPGASVSTAIGGIDEVDPLSIARYLDSQQAEARGASINTSKELSTEDRDYMVTSLVMQVESAMRRGVRPAFYSEEDRAKQVEEYAKIQPMMRGGRTASGLCIDGEDENGDCKPSDGVSPNAEFLFRATQALTSIGATPYQNMRMTDEALTGFFENPDPDARLGSDANLSGASERIVRNSLNRLHGIIDRVGLDAAREMFMGPEIPVEELQSYFSSRIPGSDDETFDSKAFLRGEMSPPFAIFGPKVGPFFANNNGNLDPLTADLWFTRTWTRLSGELVKEMRPELAMKHGEALLGITGNIPRPELAALGVNGTAFRKAVNEMKKTGTIPATIRDWAQVRVKQYHKDGFPTPKKGTGTQKRYELDRLATNIMDNVASSAEAPQNGSQRANMVSVMKEVSTRTGVPVAYLQDILWQDEQDAWGTLGSRTSTQPGVPSLFSDVIKDVAASRVRRGQNKRSYEGEYQPEILPYDEKGGVEQLLWDQANFEVDTDQFVDMALALLGRGKESRAFCATGEGNGIDNSCGSDGKPATGGDKAPESDSTSSTVKIGDKQEEIDSRLGKLGVSMGDAMAMASGGADGVYTFIRRDQEKPSESGLHIETTRDVAGVKDGMFSQTVIRNAGSENDPEIVVDHKLMEVKPEVAADPEKRHAAARGFFRGMTESVEAAMKAGASKVVMNAAGNPKGGSFRGYTIWPRMGFDAPIPFNIRNKLPKDLDHCRTLLDLHATPAGTRWWRDNGTDLDVQLDLKRADSPQMQLFGRFVRHFERDKRELAYGPGEGWLSPADQAKLDELWEQVWDDGLLDDYTGDDEDFAQVEEKRAFCPNGEGNGIDNSCASGQGALDNSWKNSDEAVEVWEGDDLQGKSPIKGGEKLKSFAIENPAEMKTALKAVGVSLTDAVTMCASPSEGTTVIVSPEHPYDSMGLANFAEESEGLVHTMTTKDIAGIPNAMDSNASLRKTKEGELILEYHAFHASPEAQEKAAVACAKEVIGGVVKSVSVAEKAGVSEIRLDAAGDKQHPSFQGYRIWPKFGFDGVIPRKMLTRLREQDLSPRALAEKRAGKLTIQALYETKAGQQYWEERGGEIPMTLRPGDESTPGWARFKAYRERVGKLAEKRDFSAGNEIFSEEELQKLDELWSDFRKEAAEKRAFCATGEGGGIDNSCGSGGPQAMMAPDKDSGGGWGGRTESWGKSSDTETFTSHSPLFPGAESLASIRIYRPNDVKGIVEDELKLKISDAVLASGPIIESVTRAGITMPRLEITPGQFGGIDMHWSAMGVSTGEGFRGEEAQFSPTPGTAVKAAEASRAISKGRGGLILKMNGFFVHPDFQGKGIALDSVVHSVAAPVSRLEMDAERFDHPNPSTRMTGYSVWPRFGYDAPMSEVVRVLGGRGVKLPAEYERARSLTGIYALPGGAEFWRQNGGPIRLTFDTRPRSINREILLQCVDRRRKSEGRNMANDLGGQPVGVDSDFDPAVDEVWADIVSGKINLTGTVPTQEEWDQWNSERQQGAKDGDAGEVQPH